MTNLLGSDKDYEAFRANAEPSDDELVTPLVSVDGKKGSSTCCPKCMRKICCACCVRLCTKMCCFMFTTVVLAVLGGAVAYVWFFIINKDSTSPVPPDPEVNVPDPPPGLNCTVNGYSWLYVKWDQPDYHNRAITEYELEYSTTASTEFQKAYTGRSLRTNITGLECMKSFQFRVRAANVIGRGNYSRVITCTTLNGTIPGEPGIPSPVTTSTSSLEVQWFASEGRGYAVNSYVLEMRSNAETDDDKDGKSKEGEEEEENVEDSWHTVYSGGNTSFLQTGLTEGDIFYFRVKAVSDVGPSGYSQVSRLHTDRRDASVPLPFLDGNLSTEPMQYQILIKLDGTPDDGGAEVTSFLIERDNGPKTTFPYATLTVPRVPESRAVILDDLQPMTKYQFRIRRINSVGKSDWSPMLDETTISGNPPPAPKQAPIMTDVTSMDITVAWNSEDTPQYNITAYELSRDDWWFDRPSTPIYNGTNLTFQAGDLLPQSKYTFRMRTLNQYGWSSYGPSVTWTTNPKGFCGNTADMKVYYDTKLTMKPAIQGCLIRCATSDTACVNNCINQKVGLSIPCASCWAAEGQCTLKSCLIECRKPSSEECAQCSKDKCFPACVECSGVPMWAFPP